MQGRRSPPPESPLTYALIYARVSTAEQAREGISLDAQLAECRRYAAAHGWVLADEWVDVLSGTRDARPEYQALLQACRERRAQGQAVAVVVLRLDRLGRRLLERVRARDELKALGVPVHSVREGGEVSDLVSNILASVAQEEVRLIGERVSDARAALARGGWWSGGRPPWGYRLRPATAPERAAGAPRNVLELDPLTTPFAQEAAARVAAGASMRTVARWVAELPSAARAGRRLPPSRLRDYLRSEAWRGLARGQPARWPALLDARTIAALDARAARWARGQQRTFGRYLLTGLLRCPSCGGPMGGTAAYGAVNTRYRCYGWGVRRCWRHVMAASIEADVLRQVQARLRPLLAGDTRALQRRWLALQQPRVSAPAAQQAAYERARATAQRRLTDAATRLVDGDLDRQGYALVRAQAEADLRAADAALAALPAAAPVALPTWPVVRALLGQWERHLAAGDTRPVRALLLELIERIEAQRPRRGVWEGRITWSPVGEALGALWPE